MYLRILVACVFASWLRVSFDLLEVECFPNDFAVVFKDEKIRASLHLGCRHLCILVACIVASLLRV